MARIPSVSEALQRRLWARDQRAARLAEVLERIRRINNDIEAGIATLNAQIAQLRDERTATAAEGDERQWN